MIRLVSGFFFIFVKNRILLNLVSIRFPFCCASKELYLLLLVGPLYFYCRSQVKNSTCIFFRCGPSADSLSVPKMKGFVTKLTIN